MAKKLASPATATATPYFPTSTERQLMDEWLDPERRRLPKVAVTLDERGNGISTKIEHPEPTVGYIVLIKALGLKSAAQMKLFLNQACAMAKFDQPIKAMEDEVNAIISLTAAQGPTDITEAMLCLQMAGIHLAAGNTLSTLRNAETMDTRIAAGQLANKLTRTFTMQMDALKRYRTKGNPQKVVVEHKHIHVAPGAQAVFGDVTTGGGVETKTGGQPHVRGLIEKGTEEPIDILHLSVVPEREAA